MKTTTFTIEGMRCDACAETIKTLVGSEPGVRLAAVSFKDGEARVLYEPDVTDADRLAAAIERPGFKVVERR